MLAKTKIRRAQAGFEAVKMTEGGQKGGGGGEKLIGAGSWRLGKPPGDPIAFSCWEKYPMLIC